MTSKILWKQTCLDFHCIALGKYNLLCSEYCKGRWDCVPQTLIISIDACAHCMDLSMGGIPKIEYMASVQSANRLECFTGVQIFGSGHM